MSAADRKMRVRWRPFLSGANYQGGQKWFVISELCLRSVRLGFTCVPQTRNRHPAPRGAVDSLEIYQSAIILNDMADITQPNHEMAAIHALPRNFVIYGFYDWPPSSINSSNLTMLFGLC
jgi:hypothetical protein